MMESVSSALSFERCDFAVVSSYLEFFGLPFTHRSLSDFLDHSSRPSCMTEIAECLAQHGLEITLINSGQNLFSRYAWNSFFSPPGMAGASYVSPSMIETERIMRNGVRIRRSIISQQVIDAVLDGGQPLIIGYDPALLHPVEKSSFQQAIITKATADGYELFEPSHVRQRSNIPKHILLAAILATKNQDPSAQSLITGKERDLSPVDQDHDTPEELPEL